MPKILWLSLSNVSISDSSLKNHIGASDEYFDKGADSTCKSKLCLIAIII
jgi:hypothetical protein